MHTYMQKIPEKGQPFTTTRLRSCQAALASTPSRPQQKQRTKPLPLNQRRSDALPRHPLLLKKPSIYVRMCTSLRKIMYFGHSWQKTSENRGKPFASHGDEATVLTNTPSRSQLKQRAKLVPLNQRRSDMLLRQLLHILAQFIYVTHSWVPQCHGGSLAHPWL